MLDLLIPMMFAGSESINPYPQLDANYATSGVTLSNQNLSAAFPAGNSCVRADYPCPLVGAQALARDSYFEVTVNSIGSGVLQVGVALSTNFATGNLQTGGGIYWQSDGHLRVSGTITQTAPAFVAGDVIGIRSTTTGVQFIRNGVAQNTIYQPNRGIFPAAGSTGGGSVTFNFATVTPPSGSNKITIQNQVTFVEALESRMTIPSWVNNLSVVCVEGGGNNVATGSQLTVMSSIPCRARNGARIGDGGGDGASGGAGAFTGNDYSGGGGGGAGGYSGNGGTGTGGSGGNGGAYASDVYGTGGGGVGLCGVGSSGSSSYSYGGGGSGGLDGGTYQYGGFGGRFGGGGGGAPWNGGYGAEGYYYGYHGGALAYKNNIAVTPGSLLSAYINLSAGNCGIGAVRVMFGSTRTFPSNAGDL